MKGTTRENVKVRLGDEIGVQTIDIFGDADFTFGRAEEVIAGTFGGFAFLLRDEEGNREWFNDDEIIAIGHVEIEEFRGWVNTIDSGEKS